MTTIAPIGLGVVGLGRAFTLMLPALKASQELRLAAAFDVRPSARRKFEAEFGGRSHESLECLLSDPAVDAVYIATPHELHAEQTVAAARAGKHILVEKPMAIRVADCQAMIAAARAAGVALVVGPSHGFDAPVQRAADLIGSGAFGPVRLITTFNFTDFVYRPRRPEELDPERGGGVVHSQAAHQFDVVRRLAGQSVSEIMAIASNWDHERPGNGAYTALVRFTGGAAASLTYSGYAHYDSDELMEWISELGHRKNPIAYGQARRALAGLSAHAEAEAKMSRSFGGDAEPSAEAPVTHNEHFGFLLASCERADLRVMPDRIGIFSDEKREFLPVTLPRAPRAGVITEFLAAVRGEQPARHDGEWGLATMQCCTALARSSASGRAVKLA
jgi:phthalate 4,5-cis-dihydrodiol dehydrogenase